MRRRIVTLLILAFSSAFALAQRGDDSSSRYRIGPRDLIEIEVAEDPSLNAQRRVPLDGVIDVPFIGQVPVGGLTTDEAATRLKSLLEENLLQRASVEIRIVEFRSRPISVVGAVRSPGPLHLSGRLTLLQALTEAGGLTEKAGTEVQILRRAENGLTDRLTIDLVGLIERVEPELDVPIYANDLIDVVEDRQITVLFLGEATKTGAVEFQASDRVTVLNAIARIGGLSDRASKKLLIRRVGRDGRVIEIPAHYKRILEGVDPDVPLQDGDIILVKESFF